MKAKGSQFDGFDYVSPSMGEHPLAEHIEMVPIERIRAAGESWVSKLWTHETGYMENLAGQIRSEGYQSPVQLKRRSWPVGSETLWEGNHRLAVAQRLGHTHLPAVGVEGEHNEPARYKRPSEL